MIGKKYNQIKLGVKDTTNIFSNLNLIVSF